VAEPQTARIGEHVSHFFLLRKTVHKERKESQRKNLFASLCAPCGQFSFFQGVVPNDMNDSSENAWVRIATSVRASAVDHVKNHGAHRHACTLPRLHAGGHAYPGALTTGRSGRIGRARRGQQDDERGETKE
jgi:hypothetical protein